MYFIDLFWVKSVRRTRSVPLFRENIALCYSLSF